jgi:hypothetical protein
MANQQNEPVVMGTSGSQVSFTADQATALDQVKTMARGWFPNDEGSANAAVSAAARYLNTDPSARVATIEDLRGEIADTRGRAATVLAMARGTVVVAMAVDGWSESGLAQSLGVDRMTIRKWRGKRD